MVEHSIESNYANYGKYELYIGKEIAGELNEKQKVRKRSRHRNKTKHQSRSGTIGAGGIATALEGSGSHQVT